MTCLGRSVLVLISAVFSAFASDSALEAEKNVFDSLYGDLKRIDQIDCSASATHEFKEYPAGASRIETILGRKCRVLPNDGPSCYFSYIIGKGKGLKAGGMYVLVVEYPEDQPRAFTICNKGNESNLGLATGVTTGDAFISKYINSNPEMIHYPLSGKFEATKSMFQLHDRTAKDERALRRHDADRTRTPEDGFSVAVSQFGTCGDPLNRGAAVSRISLYEVLNPEKTAVEIPYPPAELPRRHIFWREEMGDDMVSGVDGNPKRGIAKAVDYYRYKYNLMRFLAINTFCKDLLEFGHNQGWDSAPYGGTAWYNQSRYPERWEEILAMLSADRKIYVLPYYEYAGSIGQNKKLAIGSQCRAQNVNGEKKYTHIWWSGAPKCNADLADPDFVEDARRLLECTQTRFKDKVNFLGARFRPRPEGNPVSFNDSDLERYFRETGKKVDRSFLAKNLSAQEEYIAWFLRKRREWMLALRDYLRKEVHPDAKIFYTVDASEPGRGLGLRGNHIVTDDVELWKRTIADPKMLAAWKRDSEKNTAVARWVRPQKLDDIVKTASGVLTRPCSTWGKWRWDLANPHADPQNFKTDDGLNLSYTFNRLYTVGDPEGLERFRCRDGLLMVRHYSLNENNMQDSKDQPVLGYYCAQFDRSREHGMLAEARALINGDPRYLGYLAPMNMGRLFPEYTRAFNLAFLALPAVPSRIVEGCSDDRRIGVREYPAKPYGTYYAVVNMGLDGMKQVPIRLPVSGTVVNLVTGKKIPVKDGMIRLDFYSGQVYALNVR